MCPDSGELDGIADQIHQHLTQTPGIAAERAGNARRDVRHERQRFALDRATDQLDDAVDDRFELEFDDLELRAARLELREVEDIVDDPEQSQRRIVDRSRAFGLIGIEFRRAAAAPTCRRCR